MGGERGYEEGHTNQTPSRPRHLIIYKTHILQGGRVESLPIVAICEDKVAPHIVDDISRHVSGLQRKCALTLPPPPHTTMVVNECIHVFTMGWR